ncbi:MAG: hypothetical protein PVJ68_05865 [Candidatus Thiodiazotropha sp.]|jgi:capsular polysaccharide export protein
MEPSLRKMENFTYFYNVPQSRNLISQSNPILESDHPLDEHIDSNRFDCPFHSQLTHLPTVNGDESLAPSISEHRIVNRSRPAESKRQPTTGKILLLQGPIGPFFKHLQSSFEAECFEVKRVLFHSADALFAHRRNTIRFSGDIRSWENWLRTELRYNKPDAIVLFGSSRPAHKIAQKLALEFCIKIVALEEGYLRSGFITCEADGNNQHSPLCAWEAAPSLPTTKEPLGIPSSFITMCAWGAAYYLWRELMEQTDEKDLYHRHTNGALTESIVWTTHIIRKITARLLEKRTIAKLLQDRTNGYILVPLQTPSDAQIRTASRGWNNEKLAEETIKALKKSSARETVVFKTHPLDEKSHVLAKFIRKLAQAHDLCNQVIVLRSGKIGELTKQSSGMIVINSTSAFSALHQHIPVLVLGDAIFRHNAIVTIGENTRSITKFLSKRSSKDASDISAFFAAVKANALLPGDFYALKTQKLTATNVMSKVTALIRSTENSVVAAQ